MKEAFIIRHSKREHVARVQEHAKAQLTKEGIAAAEDLGKWFAENFQKVKVYSSPIDRCVDTGRCIQRAFSNNTDIVISSMMGEPGPFVYGDAIESFNKLGTVGVVVALEEGRTLPLIRSKEEGTQLLIDHVLDELRIAEDGTALVFVTHDACVAPAINLLAGEFFDEKHWIEYLGGLEIQINEGEPVITRFKGILD